MQKIVKWKDNKETYTQYEGYLLIMHDVVMMSCE